MPDMPELLTVDDVARITRLSKYTVRAAIRECDLVATRLRGRYLVAPADLEAWIDAGRVKPTPSFTLSREERDAIVRSGLERHDRRRRTIGRDARQAMKELNAREAINRQRDGRTAS